MTQRRHNTHRQHLPAARSKPGTHDSIDTPFIPSNRRARTVSSLSLGAALALFLAAGSAVGAIVDESGDAVATLAATQGSTASGKAAFQSAGKDGTRIMVEVSGLEPGSVHGMHVHEKGDCNSPDASSAGPHFSLAGQQHGAQHGETYHAGDLGNVTADASGKVKMSLVVPATKLTLDSGPLSVVGRAVVVHAGPDDLKSQPAGNSGARIACGVVDRQTVKDGKMPMTPATR